MLPVSIQWLQQHSLSLFFSNINVSTFLSPSYSLSIFSLPHKSSRHPVTPSVLFHHWADGWFAERCIFDVKGSSMFFVCVFHISRHVPGLIQNTGCEQETNLEGKKCRIKREKCVIMSSQNNNKKNSSRHNINSHGLCFFY